jgi:hypothetical protein
MSLFCYFSTIAISIDLRSGGRSSKLETMPITVLEKDLVTNSFVSMDTPFTRSSKLYFDNFFHQIALLSTRNNLFRSRNLCDSEELLFKNGLLGNEGLHLNRHWIHLMLRC